MTICDIPQKIPNMQLCYIARYLRDWHFSILKSQAAEQGRVGPGRTDV